LEGPTNLKEIKSVKNQLTSLINDEKLQNAQLILDSLVDEVRVTMASLPLGTYLATIDEDKLNQAFQIEHKEDLSKQENKDKISHLVMETNQDINVAEALGYGTKKDFEPLYQEMDALKKSIGTAGYEGEWQKIKNALSTFKNKIIHPRDQK
jgi:hypothetical protein